MNNHQNHRNLPDERLTDTRITDTRLSDIRLTDASVRRLADGTASEPETQAWCAELERLTSVAGLAESGNELRDGWDVLCQALSRQDANWDERPFLASLEREERAARRRVVWSLTLSLSLVGLIVGAFWWLDARSQATVAQLVASGSMRPRSSGPEAKGHEAAVAVSSSASEAGGAAKTASSFGWDDELDQQLEEVEESLVVLRSQWRGGANDGERLLEQLESLRSEWEAETL